jgi:hypothetical protein
MVPLGNGGCGACTVALGPQFTLLFLGRATPHARWTRRQEKPLIGCVMQITISNQANAIFKLGH